MIFVGTEVLVRAYYLYLTMAYEDNCEHLKSSVPHKIKN
jgi:hypothetical protein